MLVKPNVNVSERCRLRTQPSLLLKYTSVTFAGDVSEREFSGSESSLPKYRPDKFSQKIHYHSEMSLIIYEFGASENKSRVLGPCALFLRKYRPWARLSHGPHVQNNTFIIDFITSDVNYFGFTAAYGPWCVPPVFTRTLIAIVVRHQAPERRLALAINYVGGVRKTVTVSLKIFLKFLIFGFNGSLASSFAYFMIAERTF